MKCTSYYPVLMVRNVAQTAEFYKIHLRFKPLFESDWYVHLQSSEDESVNLGIVEGHHETVPDALRGYTHSICCSILRSRMWMRNTRMPLHKAYPSIWHCAMSLSANVISSRKIPAARCWTSSNRFHLAKSF
jgi:hypothetical protein